MGISAVYQLCTLILGHLSVLGAIPSVQEASLNTPCHGLWRLFGAFLVTSPKKVALLACNVGAPPDSCGPPRQTSIASVCGWGCFWVFTVTFALMFLKLCIFWAHWKQDLKPPGSTYSYIFIKISPPPGKQGVVGAGWGEAIWNHSGGWWQPCLRPLQCCSWQLCRAALCFTSLKAGEPKPWLTGCLCSCSSDQVVLPSLAWQLMFLKSGWQGQSSVLGRANPNTLWKAQLGQAQQLYSLGS
jgi:hypothetical protein